MIVWLASYPRSGNTYFRILLNHLYGIKTPTAYVGHDGTAFAVGKELVGHVADEWTIEEMAAKSETLIVKTHRRAEDNYPAIYLFRDGRDALVSYAHLRDQDGKSYEDVLRELITTSKSSTGTWGQNACHWLNRNEGNTVYISYEALMATPEQVVEQTLQQLNLPYDLGKKNKSAPTFEELKQVNHDFFRRGIVGSYRDEMPSELQELFWAQPDNAEAMKRFGFGQ